MEKSLSLLNVKLMLHKEFPACNAGLLGEYLCIPNSIITTLKHDSNGNSNIFFNNVINHWLNNGPEISWEKLAKAVELCEYASVANGIRRKYCSKYILQDIAKGMVFEPDSCQQVQCVKQSSIGEIQIVPHQEGCDEKGDILSKKGIDLFIN